MLLRIPLCGFNWVKDLRLFRNKCKKEKTAAFALATARHGGQMSEIGGQELGRSCLDYRLLGEEKDQPASYYYAVPGRLENRSAF